MPLKLDGLTKSYDASGAKRVGVDELSLSISPGEGLSLLGPSGCGKTTTLRLLGGLEQPDRGRLFHHGKDITKLPPQKREIRTVFQKYALFPHLNVEENIAFGLRIQKKGDEECRKKTKAAMELLEIPHLLGRPVQKLSGGEQQRVALARAIITEPQVLLLDEPLSALDLKLRERMQLELLSLRHKLGATFIFVTHDQGEAMALSDRVAVMRAGRIEQVGSPEEIYRRPKTKFVASFIGQANFLVEKQLQFGGGGKGLSGDEEWMIRPEHIAMRKPADPVPENSVGLEAILQENAFLGADRLTKLADTAGNPFLVRRPSFEDIPQKLGEKVLLTWKVEDMWTMRAGSD